MPKITLPTLLLVLMMCAPAKAELCAAMPSEPDSPRAYLNALTNAFIWFQESQDQSLSLSKATDGPDFLIALKRARQAAACAGKQVAGYEMSKIEGVQESAVGVQTTSLKLCALDAEEEEHFTSMLNGDSHPARNGDQAQAIANKSLEFGDAWRLLMPSVGAAADSLVEMNPTTRRAERLLLTSAERVQFVRKLSGAIPGAAGIDKNDLTPLEGAASMLIDFVSNKEWKSHEVPFSR